MTPNLASSFLSFPDQSSHRQSLNWYSISGITHQSPKHPSSPFRHLSYNPQRQRPSPIDLYALPTLEALPTPPSSSSPSHRSSIDYTLESRPRRLKKTPSQGEIGGIMRTFTKKRKDKDKDKVKKEKNKDKDKQNQATSFLPFDTEPPLSPSRRPSSPTSRSNTNPNLPRPPAGISRRPRPAPLDPTIFGHRFQVVKAEDPIDMVLRLESEARIQAVKRSFSPFSSGHGRPPPPSDAGAEATHRIRVERVEDPFDAIIRLEAEAKQKALQQSFTSFGDDHSTGKSRQSNRSRGQGIDQSDRSVSRVTDSRAGSLRQRHHGNMPSIQGVIEEVESRKDREKRETIKLPMMAPPPTGRRDDPPRLPTSASQYHEEQTSRAPSPTASTPREYFYPRPVSPPSNRIPGFTNRSPPSRNATIDESPTLGSIHLPEDPRHHSLATSTIVPQSEQAWRSSDHAEPDDERLTALEILEEIHGGQEDGWEFGVLATQRIQAGLEYQDFKPHAMSDQSTPREDTAHHHSRDRASSIKEVANSVRSWRESRKKHKDKDGRPTSDQSIKPKPGSIRPKPSYEGLEPLYEVQYTVEKDIAPPPIPPRAPGRSAAPAKLQIQRVASAGSNLSAMDVPIVLDSPVRATGMRDGMETVRGHDNPESVVLSPPTSPTPIHQRPLPPLPVLSPVPKSRKAIMPLSSLKQADSITRLLRTKRPSTAESSLLPWQHHHSTPPSFTQPLSPLNSPPPSSPRPRLSAREEPHASLPSRPDASFSIDRAQSRKHGMTALSFLALEDPTQSWARSTTTGSDRNSLDGSRRRESVQAHIIPPEELAKLISRRRASWDSEHSLASVAPQDHHLEDVEEEDETNRVGRVTCGLSPPPRHNRRSFEPPPRVEEEDLLPNSLSPPPRPWQSLSSRRPSDSPSTMSNLHDHLCQARALSPLETTPSPAQSFAVSHMSTPSPLKHAVEFNLYDHSPGSDTMGHASELRQASYGSVTYSNSPSPTKEMDKQALNEWLSKPRIRKASVPVHGISRSGGMLI